MIDPDLRDELATALADLEGDYDRRMGKVFGWHGKNGYQNKAERLMEQFTIGYRGSSEPNIYDQQCLTPQFGFSDWKR